MSETATEGSMMGVMGQKATDDARQKVFIFITQGSGGNIVSRVTEAVQFLVARPFYYGGTNDFKKDFKNAN